ncbi:hypothetical protein NDA12_005336 [Ustilago hordei]|nr:hypothetical protein NDA15_007038 [Ustilago hordei]KAJ1588242.1 hypothetical protein NDA12_005336 [Ustilago hordei]
MRTHLGASEYAVPTVSYTHLFCVLIKYIIPPHPTSPNTPAINTSVFATSPSSTLPTNSPVSSEIANNEPCGLNNAPHRRVRNGIGTQTTLYIGPSFIPATSIVTSTPSELWALPFPFPASASKYRDWRDL